MKYTSAPQRIHGAMIAARYSTDNQDEVTIDVQVSECREWCQAHGLPVIGVYADYAVSGMKHHRPEFDAMLAALREGQADTVVFYDQSRLIRGFLDWFGFRRELDLLNVRIVSITQDFVGGDLMDTSTLIQETFTALHNQMHVADTRRKVKSALRYRALQGQHTGGKPPLGYDNISKHLVINEAEAAIVRRIFEEYAAGRSYSDIVSGLNADGLHTKGGKSFGVHSLHDLLKNRRYIGEFVYGAKAYTNGRRLRSAPPKDTVTIQHPELAIITQELFDRVQMRMSVNQRAQAGRRPSAREYPLRGKVFCGECGSTMTIVASTGKGHRYAYYECTGKKHTHECSCRKIRVDDLEQKVLEYVRSVLGNEDVMSIVRDLVRTEADSIIRGGVEKMRALASELSSVDSKIDRITDAIADVGKSDSLISKLRKLEVERAEIQTKLFALRNAAEVSATPTHILDDLLEQIRSNYSDAAVLSAVTRIKVYSDRVRVYTIFDPDPTSDPPDDGKFIKIDGIPSDVPSIYISPIGLLIEMRR